MAKASDNKFPKVQFTEEAAPATPSTGEAVIYVKTDGKIYLKDDAGTETDLSGGGSAAAASGARVYNSANIALTDGAITYLTFDSERWDDAGYHDTVSNTGRLTVPSAGRYLIGGHVRITSGGTTSFYAVIRKDGADIIALSNGDLAASLPGVSLTTVWDATGGSEYFELGVFIGGASKNAINAASYSPEFWIERLGDT